MVNEVIVDFPRTLSGLHTSLIDWNRPVGSRRKNIKVQTIEDVWLIKVYSKRCRLDGHVITPKEPECDPRYEGYITEWDCND